jgi:hypothetical protein
MAIRNCCVKYNTNLIYSENQKRRNETQNVLKQA